MSDDGAVLWDLQRALTQVTDLQEQVEQLRATASQQGAELSVMRQRVRAAEAQEAKTRRTYFDQRASHANHLSQLEALRKFVLELANHGESNIRAEARALLKKRPV